MRQRHKFPGRSNERSFSTEAQFLKFASPRRAQDNLTSLVCAMQNVSTNATLQEVPQITEPTERHGKAKGVPV